MTTVLTALKSAALSDYVPGFFLVFGCPFILLVAGN